MAEKVSAGQRNPRPESIKFAFGPPKTFSRISGPAAETSDPLFSVVYQDSVFLFKEKHRDRKRNPDKVP